MNILYVQKDKLIRVAQSFEMANCPLDALIGMQTVACDDEPIIAACHLVVDPNAIAHEI